MTRTPGTAALRIELPEYRDARTIRRVSFGSIPGTSGQSKSATLRLTNVTASQQTYYVTIDDDWADGVLFSAKGTLTVDAGQGADVTIFLDTVKGSPEGKKQAALRVSTSKEIAHAVVFALIGSGTGAPGQHLLPPARLR